MKALVFFGWLCLGVAVVHLGAARGTPTQPEAEVPVSASWAYAVWAVLGAAAVFLWAWSNASGSPLARPAAVVQRLATGPVLRVLLGLGWMWVGWHLFAR